MDEWAKTAPDKVALLWTSERGEEVKTTFLQFKEETDRTAAYFLSLGIGRGDKVMLILKRHYQWWLSMMALCKIGAVAIPATHMLTANDIVYRNQRASVKAIICANDEYITTQITKAMLIVQRLKCVLLSILWHKKTVKYPKVSMIGTLNGTRLQPLCALKWSIRMMTRC